MKYTDFVTTFFVGAFATLTSYAQITSQPIQQTLDARDLQNFSSYYKSNISAKCQIPQEYMGSVFKADDLAKYSRCVAAPGSQGCANKDLNAALLASANKVCDSIAANKGKSSNGIQHVDTEKTAAVTKSPVASASTASVSAAPRKASAATSASSTSSSSSASSASAGGSGRIVAGPCMDDSCASSGVRYSWGIPAPSPVGFLDSYDYQDRQFNAYARPQAECDASKAGQLMSVDFGTEKRAVVCMASNSSGEELGKYYDKLKTANVDSLPTEVAVKNAQYKWEVVTPALPFKEGEGVRACYSKGVCGKSNLGSLAGASPCSISKCIRIDGGPVKAKSDDADKAKQAASAASAQESQYGR